MANIAVLAGSNYVGTPNQLGGCGYDVRDISNILKQNGFSTTILTDATDLGVEVSGLPTKELILNNLNNMIAASKPGDTVLFYYSGHGTQIPSANGELDYIVPLDVISGPNGFDESKLISSNELHNSLIKVPQGVKLLMVSDSCFSGNIDDFKNNVKVVMPPKFEPFKHLKSLIEKHNKRSESSHGALTLIAGCKKNQESTDLGTNGALTAAIKNWIAANSVAAWLTACFDYASKALEDLKAALTATLVEQGITDQDPQISWEADTGVPALAPVVADAPVAAPVDTPVVAPVAAPVDAPVVAPVAATPVAAPVDTPVVVPVTAPTDAPVDAPVAAPVAAPVDTPVVAPVAAPVVAPAKPAHVHHSFSLWDFFKHPYNYVKDRAHQHQTAAKATAAAVPQTTVPTTAPIFDPQTALFEQKTLVNSPALSGAAKTAESIAVSAEAKNDDVAAASKLKAGVK